MLKNILKRLGGKKRSHCIKLNYVTDAMNTPRWGYTKPPHDLLNEVIGKNSGAYANLLRDFMRYGENFLEIPRETDAARPLEPCLDNSWFTGLDAFSLYSFLAAGNPERFVEVGSGNSTKFARRAIRDHKLRTVITSIDPQPRSEIDAVCDEVVRKPVEELDVSFFERLREGDFLFIDNSHRTFMNSDVTALFIDVLPRLRRGVVVEIHDIFLPYDYPPHWGKRFYSEQYLLAAFLLSGGTLFDILLPNNFVSNKPELRAIADPVFENEKFKGINRDGCSFWLVTA